MNRLLGRVRPQVLTAILLLGVIAVSAMVLGYEQVAVGSSGGIGILANNLIDGKKE